MKSVLYIICLTILLTSTGCLFWGGREHSDRGGPTRYGDYNEHSGDMGHQDHPGDMDHQEHH